VFNNFEKIGEKDGTSIIQCDIRKFSYPLKVIYNGRKNEITEKYEHRLKFRIFSKIKIDIFNFISKRKVNRN
jgi:hypothetical protein